MLILSISGPGKTTQLRVVHKHVESGATISMSARKVDRGLTRPLHLQAVRVNARGTRTRTNTNAAHATRSFCLVSGAERMSVYLARDVANVTALCSDGAR
jgi:hypothetical protein